MKVVISFTIRPEVIMEESVFNDLKAWRDRFGISQKRLSELAKISLTTLRHIEIGSHKPQKRTKRKLMSTLRNVETNPPIIRKRTYRKTEKTEKNVSGTRSRETKQTGPIRLTNLDLELIARILNMTSKEKLNLLRELM